MTCPCHLRDDGNATRRPIDPFQLEAGAMPCWRQKNPPCRAQNPPAFDADVAAIAATADEMGRALLTAHIGEAAGIVGASELRRSIEVLFAPTPTRDALAGLFDEFAGNPPLTALFGAIKAGASKAFAVAERAVVGTASFAAKNGALVATIAGAFAVPPVIRAIFGDSAAQQIADVSAQKDLIAKQLDRAPPGEALAWLAKVKPTFSSSSGVLAWLPLVAVGLGALFVWRMVR